MYLVGLGGTLITWGRYDEILWLGVANNGGLLLFCWYLEGKTEEGGFDGILFNSWSCYSYNLAILIVSVKELG